ncbi:MAG TPA: hypothetical protein VH637_14675 [Streptosporangiaceae bacterium]|jgi:hypothetical protein
MATIAVTAPAGVLSQLPAAGSSFPLALAASTAADNGDGTWTVTAMTDEANIPALTALGATVTVIEDDAAELARWQAIDSQVDNEPPLA